MVFPHPKKDINLACYNPIIPIKTNSNTILLWSMSAGQTKAALHNTILINGILLSSY